MEAALNSALKAELIHLSRNEWGKYGTMLKSKKHTVLCSSDFCSVNIGTTQGIDQTRVGLGDTIQDVQLNLNFRQTTNYFLV